MNAKRLQGLQRLADSRQQAAARELGRCLAALEHEKTELNRLQSYLAEYAESSRRLSDPARLENASRFMEQLGLAISQQEEKVAEAQRTYQNLGDRWRSLRGKSTALDQLVDKYFEQARRERALIEQKELDENAVR